MKSRFEFCDVPEGLPQTAVLVRDVGHRDGLMSVTNDAEAVVQTLLRVMVYLGEQPPGRIFYYDSDGHLSELGHDGAQFTRFEPAPDGMVHGECDCGGKPRLEPSGFPS